MTEILHAWALAPAAIGTCCLAADRRRVRAPELAASIVMMLAMLDAALWQVLAAPLWAALLLVAAMGLAALRSPRRTGVMVHSAAGVRADRWMTLHTTLGLVVMASLLIAMGHTGGTATGGAAASVVSAGHAHGVTPAALAVGVALAAGAFAVASGVASARVARWSDRGQYAAMGASTLLMGVAALV